MRQNYSNLRTKLVRFFLICCVALTSTQLFAAGWTPTDGGLVVNLEYGDRFLLSVWIDIDDDGVEDPGEEFFVSNYSRYTGGYFNYGSGTYMKLLPATEVTEMNEWSVGFPLARGNKALGGIAYTIWNDDKTLMTSDNFKFLGNLTSNYNDAKACDVVFVIPTNRGTPTVDGRAGLSSFDPSNTLLKGTAPFDGATGTGFLGMTYREVFMFEIPKANSPQSYTNAALVTFNTTLSTWNLSSGAGNIAKGKAAYAYADSKHDATPRTLFRLYLLDKPFVSCPSTYFFATDEQDYIKYRKNENNPQRSSDSTAAKKIYTMDYLTPMERDGSTNIHRTGNMTVPVPDSTYYYVGYKNDYYANQGESPAKMGTPGAFSQFTKIRQLPLYNLSGFNAPAGAYGRMVLDSTSTADNHGVKFEPAGYFLKVSTGTNVRMKKTADNQWTSEEMWTITSQWSALNIKATLMTGSEFSPTDPGADIAGWSSFVAGTSVPVAGHTGLPVTNQSGYARITTNSSDPNGHLEFILVNKSKHIHYDNNGFLGAQIPDQYPLEGATTLTVEASRLKGGYTFNGWNTQADGSGVSIAADQVLTLDDLPSGVSWIGDTVINLYAQATYDGSYEYAISFKVGTKRYFLMHPGSAAPRYSRARHFKHWENIWQGMANAENVDTNYINTFTTRYPRTYIKRYQEGIPEGERQLINGELVLDPMRHIVKGAIDSVLFYENFSPTDDEHLGLYYGTGLNTVLANNSWAGLFTTTSSATSSHWPDYKTPYIQNAKIRSQRYVEEYDPVNKPDSLELKIRANNAEGTYIQYDASTDQFNGVVNEGDGTAFDVSSIVVADEHFIILPDTSKTWYDVIEFGYHENEQTTKDVWSALIGKQLMLAMIIDEDTIYFHPNRDKIINDPNALYLSKDFRVTQIFEFIPDSRVTTVAEDNRVSHATTDHYWHHTITGGKNSPINVQHNGQYIDIVDTFRLTLSHGGISKIKEYRGRWKRGAAGLHVSADGSSRSRDILITTKTYHYDAEQTRYVLKPEKESYSFGPLTGQTKRLNFILTQEHYHNLRDAEDHFVREEITSIDTLTSQLQMLPGACSFARPHSFGVVAGSTNADSVTLNVIDENTSGANYDTLVISQIRINGVDQAVNVRVPLVQSPLEGNELIWSVEYGGQRYYIMAAGDNLIYRRYSRKNNILYQLNTSTHLRKEYGTADEARKITPWAFDYVGEIASRQLTLQTKYGLNKYFAIADETTPGLGDAAAKATLTYDYVNIYTNDNANFEEQVTLKYGSNKWLKFNGTALVLTPTESEASVFSWSYLQSEYYLQNNGTYPSREEAVFGYNSTSPVAIQTRYKAYRDSSMLVGNQLTYLCREDENDMADLINASGIWKTAYKIETIRDHRTATSSGLNNVTNNNTLTTTVTPTGSSPEGTMDIVDTLRVRLSLQEGAPSYHFVGNWSGFNSISDANLKIPLIRKAYRTESYDSLLCKVQNDQYTYTFPATLGADDSTFVFTLNTERHTGSHVLDANDQMVAIISSSVIDSTHAMDLSDKSRAEVRLVDEFGNTPTWCRLVSLGKNTITVKCLQSGTRAPRSAYLYLAYIVSVTKDARTEIRFINIRLTVSQVSRFDYANNQHLVHSSGASGDPLVDGFQQVHENHRILYYYPEQEVELPVRERGFYGWWRWYQISEEADKDDSDIPTGDWAIAPTNTGKYNYPFRVIGDSVWTDDTKTKKKLVTQGRYTVFHYKSKDYGNKNDPPAKSPRVVPPVRTFGADSKPTVTYAVDLSTYYDNLPMSLRYKNQVDTALMDTMRTIVEPTLSLREIFELRPWTEMAARLEGFKDTIDSDHRNLKYMEDHVVMAPLDNQLLLSTEQRYNYANLAKDKHSESLLGYYMRDDNWSTWSETPIRQDTMIWCGGWDADCKWYTYDPHASAGSEYTLCNHPITNSDDFLKVPAKTSITEGYKADTVYYCLRSRSKKTLPDKAGNDSTVDGAYWFNICRYEIIYHRTRVYGPKQEVRGKALITNDEIEQNYEVLERLNFDYNQPGPTYTVYPHPLPWADASYGYTYPETPDLPHNRYHDESDFPNNGEYGIVNRIPYTSWWNKMEQHGGASNGYMIYCDGMSSAGQVAALTLETNLCAGQKLFFSGYVGNPSNQTGKADPSFVFSVQGSLDGSTWEDITTYLTGDIKPSTNWYQIYFPIVYNEEAKDYHHFRVRIYNMASTFDGNDFIIDDMCIFATKPPLIAYQASTACVESGQNDSLTHVMLRIDYQGITGTGYNEKDVYYTVQQKKPADRDTTFVALEDGYFNQDIRSGTMDTIFGTIYIPKKDHEPETEDSIFRNISELLLRFDTTLANHKKDASKPIFRQGYIYEILDGEVRPVMYVVHQAKMSPDIKYIVRMSGEYKDLTNSICAMTSNLRVTNRMVLELNGIEQTEKEIVDMCANSTYDLSLRVKGSLYLDSVAPIDLNGSCYNDWLLYGDTADATSVDRYGYKYSDIVKVIKDILRCEPSGTTNANQFARNLSEVSRNEMARIQSAEKVSLSDPALDPYTILSHLVRNGFLTLYKSQITEVVLYGDSVQYVIFPIVGTGTDAMHNANVEVCPSPILIKLKPNVEIEAPLMVGGLNRDATERSKPVGVVASVASANDQIALRVDSIRKEVGIYSVVLRSTDDPNFLEGIHTLKMTPDKDYPNASYYHKGDTIFLTPAQDNNYSMKAGYHYTFNIIMQTYGGSLRVGDEASCEVGTVPFVLSVVPDYLRWEPKNAANSQWNDPDNWIGIDQHNVPIQDDGHFAPLPSTRVIIPTPEEGDPYPVLPNLNNKASYDSVKMVGFTYNTCDAIRLMPGAALGQQQRMTIPTAIIDMSLPNGKWALRSAPVKGMISGDLFMAQADINEATSPWEVGAFDASGRNNTTGNASYWLSLYSSQSVHYGNTEKNDTVAAAAAWARVTNGMTLSLPPGTGWAVYTRTASGRDAAVRLPKDDDIYYYYTRSGAISYDHYEHNLRSKRDEFAGGTGKAGELAFQPTGSSQEYTLTNSVASTSFVFGNPTLAYIDIWGFIADNTSLSASIGYINASGNYTTVTRETAEAVGSKDTITNIQRYLPPMHAIVLTKTGAAGTELSLTLDTNRVVTSASQKVRAAAPLRGSADSKRRGIMTITAINPVSSICTSRLLLGQGYHRAIRDGEDAVLTTINVDQFNSSTPATPFNIYASEGNYGLCIDLRDEIVNVPISFYISNLSFDTVTHLWFTGVNNIDGPLVLYDALTNTERDIIDGICLDIETPSQSHIDRYYVRLSGYTPDNPDTNPIATEVELFEMDGETAVKVFRDGNVYIIRNGHIYTMLGQKVERVGR